MQSNYKRLGDYIQEVNIRNKELNDYPLLGVSIRKELMPSIANTIGTNMATYKIIERNQFAYGPVTSRNGDKISIALSCDEDFALLSQAYTVFETNAQELLPEYLMMWFRRGEFDRYARYKSHGSARETFDWDEMCEVMLPIPSIDKQQQIVDEYNTIQNRIELNNQLITKLEETAQTIYKQWFVDFEFPYVTSSGVEMPYKSSGGKMVWCEELEKEIPERWETKKIEEYIDESLGGDWGKEVAESNYNSKVLCIRGADIPNFKKGNFQNAPIRYILQKNMDNKRINKNQIVIEISGGSPTQSTGRSALVTNYHLDILNLPIISSNFCKVLKLKDEVYSFYFYGHLEYLYNIDYLFSFENSTTGVKNFNLSAFLTEEYLLKPDLKLIRKYNNIYTSILNKTILLEQENQKLEELKELLLGRMTRVY